MNPKITSAILTSIMGWVNSKPERGLTQLDNLSLSKSWYLIGSGTLNIIHVHAGFYSRNVTNVHNNYSHALFLQQQIH